tara:strand:+ start:1604 stop:1858 length:255 start_codon:yes stop_codon:yes gene_type:complete
METILTVLITLGVVALIAAVWGVVRLSRRVDDLELMRMEMIDLEDKFEKHLDGLESSLDRRFDKVWAEVHTLDRVVNPNKDLIK